MSKWLLFRPVYLVLAIAIFLLEVYIALYVHDGIIRPYIGDFLVVILIYCFIKAFLNASVKVVATGVLVFACTLEIMQYFRLVELLHLQGSRIARIVIGTSFSWGDMVAYTMGIGAVLVVEKLAHSLRNT